MAIKLCRYSDHNWVPGRKWFDPPTHIAIPLDELDALVDEIHAAAFRAYDSDDDHWDAVRAILTR